MTSKKDLARSISTRLSQLAKKLKIPYQNLSTEFLIERLVVRLLTDPWLLKRLVFKGGYVGLRFYESPRYTVDLDALLEKGKFEEAICYAHTTAEKDLGDGVWFRFERTVDLKTQGEYGGIRLVFRAGIGETLKNLNRAQIVNFDLGYGDPITPGPLTIETPFLLGAGSLSWRVYPVETTVAEKLHALVVRHSDSSRSKDIFDLNLLLPKCNQQILKNALTTTFQYRGNPIPENILDHIKNTDRTLLKKGWASAVGAIQKPQDFDKTFDKLIENLGLFLLD